MTKAVRLALAALVLAVAAGGGYWLGSRSDVRRQEAAAKHADPTAQAPKKEKKLLYYRNPMGLPDTSPVPKKDQMGMDYVPVYEGEEDGEAPTGQIRVSTEKLQKLGVRTETAERRVLGKVVRVLGRIEADERRSYTIAPKFEGYVERLHVNVTGQAVGKGQPLFEVYSPELVSAQREYAIAAQGVAALKDGGEAARDGMQQLADSSLQRLKNWDISEEQVKALAKSGEARRTLTFRSPVAGIVTDKKAMQGMRFMPGEALYQVADLSAVWVVADVFEQDIALLRKGAQARVRINAYPDKIFNGIVSYVYPMLKAETRTVPIRIELANPDHLLKPAMFAEVELAAGGADKVVTVSNSAVIDSGTRRIVLVQVGEGRFEPREVKLGRRSDDHVAILDGVREGEAVVVAANFLIDAESNLKAAIGGLGHAAHGGGAAPQDKAASGGEHAGHTMNQLVAVGHQADGRIEGINAAQGSVTLQHGPVASLRWPAMTMDFLVANPALLAGLQPGASVRIEFVERKPGEWVITGLAPLASAAAGRGFPDHAGH